MLRPPSRMVRGVTLDSILTGGKKGLKIMFHSNHTKSTDAMLHAVTILLPVQWPALAFRTCLLGLVLLLLCPAQSVSRPAVEATNGMVVSAHRLASEAGVAMLQRGGNAIDAAVAVGYAEAVVDPCCGNIGGGGFLVAHLADDRDVFLNFRETAPGAATRDMYLDTQGNVARATSLFGWRAVAVVPLTP